MKEKKILVNILCCLIIMAGVYMLGGAFGKAWKNYNKSTEIVSPE